MKRSLLFFLFFSFALLAEGDKVIRMAYRTTEKLPLIGGESDNSGLYYDLYSEAARRIGYKLEIVRKPKKRILLDLKSGDIDFYPGFVFSEERAGYVYFINTGIKEQNVVVTLDTVEDITSFDDLRGKLVLQPLGNADYLENIDKTDITVIPVPEADLKRMIELIELGRGDLFIYQQSSILYVLKANGIGNIKTHPGLLPNVFYLHLGFSKQSPLFKSEENHSYDSGKALSIENFPIELSPSCPAFLFQQALKEMHDEGFTQKLYNSYYH